MTLEPLGWNERFESLFEPYRASNLIPARVIGVDREVVTVETELGMATVSIAGRLDSHGEAGPPAVGDWVGMDLIGTVGVVHVILPRTGALVGRRLANEEEERAAAANVDQVLVVEALDSGLDPWRIERASAMAWEGGSTPIVVLTKLDLCEDADAAIAKACEGAPFVDVLLVSAKIGVGIDLLERRLGEGTTSVMLGSSGAGKSTLMNRLFGEEEIFGAEARDSGRELSQATDSRQLFVLPAGGCLIDTPGVRELGLSLDPEVAMTAYAEIEEAARQCFLGDSRRETKAGCEVQKEVDLGDLNANGIASYLRLRREAEDLEKRRDLSKRSEIASREGRIDRTVRETRRNKKEP